MAHDLTREVFYFNRAAQEITGFKFADVIGKDCHEIFPGRFCGGNCSFCDDDRSLKTKLRYTLSIPRKDGTRREVEMSVLPIMTDGEKVEGSMILFRDMTEFNRLRQTQRGESEFQGIIGRDRKMRKVFNVIRDLADVDVPVLIQGESGTGKEMVALALHNLSGRSKNIFVPVNCGALPEGTLESELFGHVRGAFTGAIRDKKGRFELADGGTLFLDEIGEISLNMQVKLLRVLQEKTFIPVGGEKTISVDVRIISASNKELKAMTRKELFREDLFYRLAVIPVFLPPLRDRAGDIPLLVDHFIDRMSEQTGKTNVQISSRAIAKLVIYPWPGNIRELRNAVQFALIKCKGNLLDLEHFPPEIAEEPALQTARPGRPVKLTQERVAHAMAQAGQNKAKAARILKVSRTTLYRFISKNPM
jgi:PAS domain S-box-containing protein